MKLLSIEYIPGQEPEGIVQKKDANTGTDRRRLRWNVQGILATNGMWNRYGGLRTERDRSR